MLAVILGVLLSDLNLTRKLGKVAHTCNASIQKTEAGGLAQIQGQLKLHRSLRPGPVRDYP